MYNILKIDVLLEKETIWEYWRGRSSLVTLDICMFVHMYVCNNSSHLSKSYTVSRKEMKKWQMWHSYILLYVRFHKQRHENEYNAKICRTILKITVLEVVFADNM